MAAQLLLRQGEHFANLAVEIEQFHARRLPLRERPDPRDDFARPLAVGDDVVERRARFRHGGRVRCQPARACPGARDHRAQGLAHLVGDRGGQLAQRCQARHARKLCPRRLQRIVLSRSFSSASSVISNRRCKCRTRNR